MKGYRKEWDMVFTHKNTPNCDCCTDKRSHCNMINKKTEVGWSVKGALQTYHSLQEDFFRRLQGGRLVVPPATERQTWKRGQRLKVLGGWSWSDRLRSSPLPARFLEEIAGKSRGHSRRGRSWTMYRNMSDFQFFYLGNFRRSWLCKTTYYLWIWVSEILAGGPSPAGTVAICV